MLGLPREEASLLQLLVWQLPCTQLTIPLWLLSLKIRRPERPQT